MALNAANIRRGITGEVSVGATSAAAPTGTGSALTGFTGTGYVSEEGVTEVRERTTEDIKAWQNAATVLTVVTDGSLKYKFKLLETTKANVELAYGMTITQISTEGSYVIVPTTTGGVKSTVIDVIDGANIKRIYAPKSEVVEVGDLVHANGEAYGYEITLATYPDATIGGNAKVWDTALKT